MNKAIQFKQNKKSEVITTSLYELIETMQEHTSPHEDEWIIAAIADLMKTGKIYWLGKTKELEGCKQ
jgi:hypothetical protein